jgi:hypothetical protein
MLISPSKASKNSMWAKYYNCVILVLYYIYYPSPLLPLLIHVINRKNTARANAKGFFVFKTVFSLGVTTD